LWDLNTRNHFYKPNRLLLCYHYHVYTMKSIQIQMYRCSKLISYIIFLWGLRQNQCQVKSNKPYQMDILDRSYNTRLLWDKLDMNFYKEQSYLLYKPFQYHNLLNQHKFQLQLILDMTLQHIFLSNIKCYEYNFIQTSNSIKLTKTCSNTKLIFNDRVETLNFESWDFIKSHNQPMLNSLDHILHHHHIQSWVGNQQG